MDLQLMLLPAVVTGDVIPATNNNDSTTNNKMVNCRDEEAEYLDRLLTEKKLLDAMAGLDFTQKLINAGKINAYIRRSYSFEEREKVLNADVSYSQFREILLWSDVLV